MQQKTKKREGIVVEITQISLKTRLLRASNDNNENGTKLVLLKGENIQSSFTTLTHQKMSRDSQTLEFSGLAKTWFAWLCMHLAHLTFIINRAQG